MGTERVIVHASIAEEFAKKLSKSTEHIFDSSDALVLAMQSGVKKNKHLVADAMSKGATVIYGDPRFADSSSYKLRPIILRGVDKAMDIYYTESFGPTVVLYTFETEGQAIELANDTEYGLSGAVFTRDLGAALRVAKAYETGAVHVNAMTIHDEATLPHGGAKNSGHGRFNAEYGLQEFLRTKTITWKD
jgi:acyl-CoA reductase-like NAD-dependent aldehyde dehydrogenase